MTISEIYNITRQIYKNKLSNARYEQYKKNKPARKQLFGDILKSLLLSEIINKKAVAK